jgi:hypothetical protein
MNTDTGQFVDSSKAKVWMKRFHLGEVVKLKDEECEVLEIHEDRIVLRPIATNPTHRADQLRAISFDGNRHERRRQEALLRQK